MTLKEKAKTIDDILTKEYPDAKCSLAFNKDYELLVATRLSAQCTDERVNVVTPVLFERYKTLDELADAEIGDIENIVRSCGFYHDKAKSIKEMCTMLLNEYKGKVPDSIEELIKLPGVGRKTANLIVGEIYGKPAVVVDTHCIRLSNRLGLCDTEEPVKIEFILRNLLPPEKTFNLCHCFVYHGRKVCIARNPKCTDCVLNELCNYYNKKTS